MAVDTLLLLGLSALLCLLLVRNDLVCQSRLHVLDVEPIETGLSLHKQLPSYDSMLFHPKYWLLWTPSHWIAWINRKGA